LKDEGKEEEVKPSLFCRLTKFTDFGTSSLKQLDAVIGPFELELQNMISEKEKEGEETSPWKENSLQALRCAKQALYVCDPDRGWRYFYLAELMSLYLLDEKKLRGFAKATLNEAEEELSLWKKKSVQDLLGKDGVLKEKVDKNQVYLAREILQDYICLVYNNLRIARFQLRILVILALVLIGLSIWILTNLSGQIEINNGFFLSSVGLFGAMGGTVSGIISTSRGTVKGKIPEQLLNSW